MNWLDEMPFVKLNMQYL